MNLFSFEVVREPTHLPIAATDDALARAVTEEIERSVLWRAIVSQERRIVIDGPLPTRLEIEPASSIVGLTQWTPADAAVVVDESSYYSVTRDPSGTIIAPAPGHDWPQPARAIGSFALTYMAGWVVTDTTNSVPASVQLMIERAIEYRAGGAGLGDIRISTLEMDKSDSYQTDQLPRELTDIARAFFYRPVFVGRP